MILGYARISTDKQDLSSQIVRLKQAGAERIYQDVMSGKRFDRPGLTEMMDFAREGDTLCVVRLDRLGRSMRELLEIMDRLKALKVGFKSLEEQLDTTSAAGSLVFHVFAALADFERGLIAERTRDGLAVARANGNMPGRPKIDDAKIKLAQRLLAEGHSKAAAARAAGISRATFLRRLAQL
ncbi:recombinase family protein [Desulfovibrio sp. DV]|uniref:recombinase family protein n=1 Tax=Desulfovibrio sp. DV TaxID=1844708 RepID=UPI00094BA64A|nr:recombinase family protein [Desulfovibrio sp. DV]